MSKTKAPERPALTTDDRLLTEIQRQEKYLSELPENFEFPLFNSARAVESQRQSGYRTTASAAREIVDNAIEAGATKVHITFDYPALDRKKGQRREAVSAVAFIDNGSGMLPKMARYSLSWGGGTHFDDPDFIGRFGFGLPNASINQTRRVEVYTRVQGAKKFHRAVLDINDVRSHGVQRIEEPVEADLPAFVREYLEREKWSLDHGTVVVWDRPDRLSRRTGGALKEHLVDDFAVTYRYLLKGRELKVEGVVVRPIDPLFLDPTALYYEPPIKDAVDKGGAQLIDTITIPVKYIVDPETGGKHLERVSGPDDLADPRIEENGVITVKVARLPLGFAVSKKGKKEIRPMDEHSFARFEIRRPRRGMSFVRAGREIETVDVFPHRLKDEASGMGVWPMLQGYAYHWGVEVSFEPNLDDVFGIANDKQTVRPIEDFWKVLTAEEIDKLLMRENNWQTKHRAKKEKQHRAEFLDNDRETPSPAELSAQAADAALGIQPKVPEADRERAAGNRDQRAEEEAKRRNKSKQDVLDALEMEDKRRKYRILYVDADHGFLFEPIWDGRIIEVRVNKRHPFFEVLYSALLEIPGGGLAKEAVDLLLVALSKGELSENEETKEIYRVQRETLWSPFLATSMRDLERRFATAPVEEEVESNAEDVAAD